MRLFEAISAVAELPEPKQVDEFVRGLEPEWIEQALQYTGKATLRRRRLPAEQVVWLVIGISGWPVEVTADRAVIRCSGWSH